jgi:hypothetical protein
MDLEWKDFNSDQLARENLNHFSISTDLIQIDVQTNILAGFFFGCCLIWNSSVHVFTFLFAYIVQI